VPKGRDGWKADGAWLKGCQSQTGCIMPSVASKFAYIWHTWRTLTLLDRGEAKKALRFLDRRNPPAVYPILQQALKARVLMLCGERQRAEALARVATGFRAPKDGDERAAYFYLKYVLSTLEGGAHTNDYQQECKRSARSWTARACFGFHEYQFGVVSTAIH
jgi:hypothetical protein